MYTDLKKLHFFKRYGKDVFLFPLLVSFVLFLAGLYLVYEVSLNNVSENIQRTLDRVKERSLYSLRYEDIDRVNSLVRLMDKAKELARQTEHTHSPASVLKRFTRDMRLDGALILDEHLKPVAEAGIRYADWQGFIAGSHLDEIVQWPRKNSMDRLTMNGQSYDYAAVARIGRPGVILTVTKNDQAMTRSELYSLEALFPNDTFFQSNTAFITKEKTIIDASSKVWIGRPAADCPLLQFEAADRVRPTLIRARLDGASWYGYRTQARDLTVYVFTSQKTVLRSVWYFVGFMVLAYALVQIVLLFVRQHSIQMQMTAVNEQLKTIEAVSSIFMDCLLIDPATDHFSVVRVTPDFQNFIADCHTDEDIRRRMADESVIAASREAYLAFRDPKTAEKRLAESSSGYLEFVFETQSGRWLREIMIAQAYDENGRLKKLLTLAHDVSDERRREIDYQQRLIESAHEAQAAALAKTNFLRHMSHDIRTPINGILGMLEIAERHPDDAEQQKKCRRNIREASLILLELINDVLDLSKLESSRMNAEIKLFNIQKLIEESLPTLDVLSKSKNVTISFKLDAADVNVEGCPTLLRRVFMNIVTNAVKYNRDNGRVDISLTELAEKRSGRTLYELVCRDTGIGMSEEFQKQAFEPFAQENETARTKYAGTGLGLAISRHIVSQLGGTIDFVSRRTEGTTFTIRLPFKIVSAPVENLPAAAGESLSRIADLKGLRVLLAEDNELNREIAEMTLTEAGAQVEAVADGEAAVSVFTQNEPGRFDLILMDLMMPKMTGLEATKAIRAQSRPDAGLIPIVAITANVFADDVKATQDAGMNAHIAKPFNASDLIRVLSKIAGKPAAGASARV